MNAGSRVKGKSEKIMSTPRECSDLRFYLFPAYTLVIWNKFKNSREAPIFRFYYNDGSVVAGLYGASREIISRTGRALKWSI